MSEQQQDISEVASALTAVIYQLRKHQASHQSWLDHYKADPDHTCGRCTPDVLAGVGDAVEQEVSVKVYDGLIERVTNAQASLRRLQQAQEKIAQEMRESIPRDGRPLLASEVRVKKWAEALSAAREGTEGGRP